jgi:LPS export ABC transporter protein LptC
MNLSSLLSGRSCIAAMLAMVTLLTISCETKSDQIPKSDLLTLPAVTGKNITSQFTDSGKIQLKFITPLIEQYSNKESQYSEFRHGLTAIFYDGKPTPAASVTGKYAKYTNEDNLWELKDSVVVINENKDKLETELLFWDQKKDLIYTDRFVKITSDNQIIQGFGFESDSHLRKRRIKKVTATITLDN